MSRAPLAGGLVALGLLLGAGSAGALPYVALDPGHGGRDTGAVGHLPPGTPTGLPARFDRDGQTVIYEKDVNLDVAFRLDAWLRARGFRTLMTRTRDLAGGDAPSTTTLSDLRARTDRANQAGAQLFVSIHQNALSASARGTETYRFYYAGAPSLALAVAVHQEVVLRLGLPDRGVKSAGFYVLRHTLMPAVLVEGAFLSNPSEALLLARPEARQGLAEGIGAGIVRWAQGGGQRGVYGPPKRAAPRTLYIRYWTRAGRFARRADAVRMARRLSARGTDALVRGRRVRGRQLWLVVTGQFISLSNAKGQRDRLRARGYRAAAVGPAPPRRR
jgi:N-acetylmuramoyl-L-alanine amidase